ncbi:excisionase Xis [Klebsiella pneumoniae]|uniref:Excisionase Xis n=1 Tax=Klebsiella pneumoniae TaxID=573 RepID=A0A939SUD8_KLEPN|nr:excisionase Xis [Klebsiella pneumoniae]
MSNELELMKTRDICEQLCITPRTLDRYRKRKKSENPFPDPDCSYGRPKQMAEKQSSHPAAKEMVRKTRRPMSHLNLPDNKGRLIRPDAA